MKLKLTSFVVLALGIFGGFGISGLNLAVQFGLPGLQLVDSLDEVAHQELDEIVFQRAFVAGLVFQRADGRVALAAIAEARFLALEDGRELARIRVAERDRRVDRLVQRVVFDRLPAVVVQDGGGETVGWRVAPGGF